ncbi:diacylglyceryl transferase [Amylibacter kogurei]|uniref:Diacylglyceryl transferase n=1 Tax=Paramylibacter kogurei TaxID=1889778 RepID=A0A2G5K552_9RHOB|nr:YbjN domain-containing protein [Amylibacter kogurei]PIB24143.1 diacylglyceryl transferase [Amylibacter kogurei]
MAATEQYFETTDIHPIDIVENLAESRDWDFDRVGEDQIALTVEGSWRSYTLTLAWSGFDETLRLVCTFEMEPPADKMAELYEVLNLTNDRLWTGSFSMWNEERIMIYRYGLTLTGGAIALPDQIDQMMHNAVLACEKFYPAFQLVCWGDQSPAESMNVAISEAYGRA